MASTKSTHFAGAINPYREIKGKVAADPGQATTDVPVLPIQSFGRMKRAHITSQRALHVGLHPEDDASTRPYLDFLKELMNPKTGMDRGGKQRGPDKGEGSGDGDPQTKRR